MIIFNDKKNLFVHTRDECLGPGFDFESDLNILLAFPKKEVPVVVDLTPGTEKNWSDWSQFFGKENRKNSSTLSTSSGNQR